ncbi:MAG: AarF/ABC1/UbiB kinase family protein [Deltaproteobacteria bacterium]|nr:AarF/ABC1/UbiB kinase family protein [Deltaproteobacteria bacterium]
MKPREKNAGRIQGSAVRRFARVSAMAWGMPMRLAAARFRGLFASSRRRQAILDECHERNAARVLETMGQMKGALMKLAQMVSYVSSDVPETYRTQLAALQASAPPMEFDVIAVELERELGGRLDALFADIDPKPIAAASIGQVHRATLPTGDRVAVKVQYPGVEAAIRADLKNAGWLYSMLGAIYPALDTGPVVEELRERIFEELDYAHEARSQQAFADLYEDHPWVHVPRVHERYCTPLVLTSELVQGHDFAWLTEQSDEIRQRASEALYRFVFGSMLHHRAFNGDPHPGNYLFDDEGRVTFLDFGCVKYFEPETTKGIRRLHCSYLDGDRPAMRRAVEDLGFLTAETDISTELYREYMGYFYQPFAEDRVWEFTSDYTVRATAHVLNRGDPKFGEVPRKSNMPREFVFLNRLQWGLWPVLASIGARADWHRIHQEYVRDAPPATEMGRDFAAHRSAWRRARGIPAEAELWLARDGVRWKRRAA